MIDLTDAQYEIADKIEIALEAADARGLTPSALARKVKIPTAQIYAVLNWMVNGRYIHTSGNRSWTRYHAGRAGR